MPKALKNPDASTALTADPTTPFVEWLPVGSIIPYVRNPRQNQSAIAKVAASLREFGWRQPIVVDAELTVIAGHTRLLAAQSLNMTLVPVHIARGLSKMQIKAYRIADNRVAEEAEWDPAMLALEFNDLQLDGFDLNSTGFDTKEWEKILEGPKDDDGSAGGIGDVQYQVVVTCSNETSQAGLVTELEARGFACRLLTL